MTRAERAARALVGPDCALELVRVGEATSFRAPPLGIVRVTGADGRAVSVAAATLATAGAPVMRPLAGPIVHGGLSATLWDDHPDDEVDRGARYAAMGRALARLHAVGAQLAAAGEISLAPFDPRTWLAARVRSAPAALAERLVAAVDRAAGALDVGMWTVLHTDAHAGNFRVSRGRAVLIDLDQLALGPSLYDLAAAEVTERRFGRDVAGFEAFARAYGIAPDDPRLQTMVDLRELLAVGFVAGAGRPDVALARLADIEAGRRDARWSPL